MNKSAFSVVIFSFLVSILFLQTGCSTEEDREMTKEEQIERGRYIVSTSGCNDCHTPKKFTQQGMQLDSTKMLSGHPAEVELPDYDPEMVGPGKWTLTNDHLTAWVGPWGVSFSSNITPDNETGIGTLTEDMFLKTIREGKLMGVGRPLLPPMPWQDIAKMTDEDLKAIYAYLMSLEPIKNKVPEPIPPAQSK